MNKVSCPVCDFKAREDACIHFTVSGVVAHIVCRMEIKDFPFCPVCFFTPKETGEYEYFQARLDRVILQRSGIQVKSIVVKDDLGRYREMDIDDFRKLKTSGFNPSPDYGDDGSSMATDSWGGAGPDCISGPE